MHWRRVDPLQPVSALLAIGGDAVAEAKARLAVKSALFQSMRRVEGDGWMVLFAAQVGDDTAGETVAVLPSIPAMIPLYEDAPGWWLPVGTALAAPEPLRAELREALSQARGFRPPVVVVPRFDDAPAAHCADVYELS